MTDDDAARLKLVTAETLGIDEIEIDDSLSPETAPTWTSFNHLNLMSAVEQAFDVMFSMEEMAGVKNFGDLRTLLGSHK